MTLPRLQRRAILSDDGLPNQQFQQWWQQLVEAIEGKAVRNVTASETAALTDSTILCDATAGAVTLTLPAASTAKRRVMTVKKIDASGNAVTIDGDGTETIDGATTKVLATQYAVATLHCDGTEWWLL